MPYSLPMCAIAAVMFPVVLVGQNTTPVVADSGTAQLIVADPAERDSVKQTRPSVQQPAVPATMVPISISGVVFGNYQYHGDVASKQQNKFDLERAYLTFKMPAGERASIRVTTDVYQQTGSTNGADSYYKGWVVRAKYAYLQYDYLEPKKSSDWSAVARIGLVHTMFIDHEENFWPRWLSQVPVERAGYFSSADAGLAMVVTLPNRHGELYATVANGAGYASRESDRFKDYQARVTLTPLASSGLAYLRTLAVDGWVYRGAIASKYVSGGSGQIGPIGGGLDRNRWGVFAGIRDPRLIVGLDYARRADGRDTGLNTTASPRSVIDSTGRLASAYTVIKPFQIVSAKSTIPLGVVLRADNVKPSTSSSAHYDTVIAGLTWDLSNKAAISLDYQAQMPHGTPGVPATRVYYLHWVANF